jgi:hypothetical protein
MAPNKPQTEDNLRATRAATSKIETPIPSMSVPHMSHSSDKLFNCRIFRPPLQLYSGIRWPACQEKPGPARISSILDECRSPEARNSSDASVRPLRYAGDDFDVGRQ